MKGYDKTKELLYLKYWNGTMDNFTQGAWNGFQWVENKTQFNEHFINSFNEEENELYFLEVASQYPKNYINFIIIYRFYLKELILKKSKGF